MAAAAEFGVVLLILTTHLSITAESEQSGIAQQMQQAVNEWMSKQAAGSVAVTCVSSNETEYFFGGNLEPKKQSPPNDRTLYEIGSITKGFTGLLLAHQVLGGQVSLNDTLEKLLTNWPGRFFSAVGNVTLLELTTHSSGLPIFQDNITPKDPNNPYVDYTEKQLYDWLDKVELTNRSSFCYSNAGVGILGHALAITAGKKYEDLLKELVLNPLGLLDTASTLNEDQSRRMAPGHDENGTAVSNWDLSYVFTAAGGLRSSVSEFSRFLRFTTGLDKNDQQTNLREALEFATQPFEKTRDNITIGCNWFRSWFESKLLFCHSGSTGGFNSYIGWLPQAQIGCAVLASITAQDNNSPKTEKLTLDLLKMKLK